MILSPKQQSLSAGAVGAVIAGLFLHSLILGVGTMPYSLKSMILSVVGSPRLVSQRGLTAEYLLVKEGKDSGLTLIRQVNGEVLSWISGGRPVAWAPDSERLLLVVEEGGKEASYRVVDYSLEYFGDDDRTVAEGKGRAVGFSHDGKTVRFALAAQGVGVPTETDSSVTVASRREE